MSKIERPRASTMPGRGIALSGVPVNEPRLKPSTDYMEHMIM
jgi:hypothetical protein